MPDFFFFFGNNPQPDLILVKPAIEDWRIWPLEVMPCGISKCVQMFCSMKMFKIIFFCCIKMNCDLLCL